MFKGRGGGISTEQAAISLAEQNQMVVWVWIVVGVSEGKTVFYHIASIKIINKIKSHIIH